MAFVLDYLDGALPERQKKVFEWHLRMCRECRDYPTAYRRTVQTARAEPGPAEEPVPSEAQEDLIRAVLDARQG